MTTETKKPRSIKITKTPSWGFETEEGFKHNLTFNKRNEKILDGMLSEIVMMYFHHNGVDKTVEYLDLLINVNKKVYKD